MNLSVLPTTPFETRGYGSQSWNSLAALALQRWNQVGVGVGQVHDYFGIRQPTVAASTCALDGVNNVTASSTMCGLAWGDTIAVTLRRFVGSTIIEDDVIFNAGLVYDA